MTKSKAIDRIMSDLNLGKQLEGFVISIVGRFNCDDTIDLDTIYAIEDVIRNEFN